MASEASSLENELVAFVEGHPEIFSPQDVVNMRRKIIYSFGMVDAPKGTSTQYTEVIGLSGIATSILKHISSNITKKTINTSQDVDDVLHQFEFCVEFINKFLTKLCATERDWHFGGGYSSSPTPKIYCETMSQCVIPHSSQHYTGHGVPNIFELVKKKINEYQSRVLKLWADVLIRKGKITPEAIAQMKTEVDAKDGYEQQMRKLYGNPSGIAHGKNNLDDSVLLEFLTFFHVATPVQMTTQYSNLGSLDQVVGLVISQFMQTRIVNGYGPIPTGNHASELNVVNLSCVVVAKPYTRETYTQLPVMAYLSSDVLDQCVQSVGRFPSTDEFMQLLQSKKDAETTPKFEPLTPSFWRPTSPTSPTSETSETSDISPTSAFKGGKKTRRKINKKLKNVKKSKKCKKSRRRFIKRHSP
jgi:hypothetical protein